jgi:Spy/CpxP family protein refolding chaperone
MKTLTNWLLGGALAASLTWNWKLYDRGDGPPAPAGRESCEPTSCALELDRAPLDPAQKAALDEVCSRSCGESDRLERRADELQHELLASLAAETIDRAAATKLADEVSELRRRSLASCVEGILGVRSVLSGDQVRAMLERCEQKNCR